MFALRNPSYEAPTGNSVKGCKLLIFYMKNGFGYEFIDSIELVASLGEAYIASTLSSSSES